MEGHAVPVIWRREHEAQPAVGKLTLSEHSAVLDGSREGDPELSEFARGDVRTIMLAADPSDRLAPPTLCLGLADREWLFLGGLGMSLVYEIADMLARWAPL